jgi:predicted RNA-binding Zn-ribbon protein involved in translation (DUF1610 family)
MRDDDDFDDEDFDEDADFEPRPLEPEEAERVRRDLEDLAAFRRTFEPEGYKGVSVFCEDCVEEHFYGWQMLEENLTALLASGETPVHEPAYAPRPEDYVDWQYAQGYLDGLADSEVPPIPAYQTADGGCPYCGGPLPDEEAEVRYCPSCGTHMGTARVARALLGKGWKPAEVADLLRAAHLPQVRGLVDG